MLSGKQGIAMTYDEETWESYCEQEDIKCQACISDIEYVERRYYFDSGLCGKCHASIHIE